MNGILNVYKEKSYTSHDVVAKLRGIFKQKKIGHTGTLDPDAEGVLPVCLGNATKLCDMLTDRSKEYECVMLLGRTTDTQDISGKLLFEDDSWIELPDKEITDAINSFRGEYEQLPPMYSAIKVEGKKLYELAREGKTAKRDTRTVVIDDIEIQDISLPRVRMRVSCSKGTYIRTLCNDIGERLSCGACMEALIRTRSGSFRLSDALKLSQIEDAVRLGSIEDFIIPVEDMFPGHESVRTLAEADSLLLNGNKLCGKDVEKCPNNSCYVKI